MNFVVVVPMAVAIYLTMDMMQASPFIKLIVASIMGGGIYWLTCRLLLLELVYELLSLSGILKRTTKI